MEDKRKHYLHLQVKTMQISLFRREVRGEKKVLGIFFLFLMIYKAPFWWLSQKHNISVQIIFKDKLKHQFFA